MFFSENLCKYQFSIFFKLIFILEYLHFMLYMLLFMLICLLYVSRFHHSFLLLCHVMLCYVMSLLCLLASCIAYIGAVIVDKFEFLRDATVIQEAVGQATRQGHAVIIFQPAVVVIIQGGF